LGYETAKTLARWGARVIVTTRSDPSSIVAALQQDLLVEGIDATLDGHELDLSDATSVSVFVKWIEQRYGGRLDILVNNAGIHLDLMSKWKEPKLSTDGHEIQWRTNYLGTAHLTHTLLPLLQKTGSEHGDARIVNVVSQLHDRGSNEALFDSSVPYNSWQSYGLSKLALIHFSYELQRRFALKNHLQSYCLHPGGTSGTYTNVADRGLEGHPVIAFVRKLGAPFERLLMASAEEGAQTQVHCATAANAEGGHYYLQCRIGEAAPDTRDREVAERLWRETLDWLNSLPDSGSLSAVR
jgi:NAD(P)-dependent dehydrogenase (short-subunit alcohol dehydrogenase family)